MCLEPEGMYVLFAYHSFDVADGLLVQLGCRTGIDDVKHSEPAAYSVQHRGVYGIRLLTHVLVVVAERASGPTAARALQKNEFPGHLGADQCIPFHIRIQVLLVM